MKPRDVYETIRRPAPPEIEALVLTILTEHKGADNAISRKQLVRETYSVEIESGKFAYSTLDRRVRRIIEVLRKEYPIMSSSSNGGYFYASTVAEIHACARELRSRALKLIDEAAKLDSMKERFMAMKQAPLLER